ncbi:hypothetical protein Tco_1553270 [Tanacetum coccineum]
MTITRSGMTPEAIEEMITRRVAEALAEQEANRNLGPIVESKSKNGDNNENGNNGGRGNGGNGNGGNENGGRNGNNRNNNGNGDHDGNAGGAGALTWWNSHKRKIRTEAAYALTWIELMKLMTERFQELILLCPKMVPKEEDRVERYIWGLLDNIQGNVTSSAPTRLQDAVRMGNSLMD